MKEKIIVALDTHDLGQAEQLVGAIGSEVGAFKIGHALTLSNGLVVIERLRAVGAERIFLDLKFHDIPSVVGLAMAEAARRGVWMVTVHASGGSAMIKAAVRASEGPGGLLVMAVTTLTSLDADALRDEVGVARGLDEHTLRLAELARRVGAHGVIASAHEAMTIRQRCGPGFLIVTPGIRSKGADAGDQRRVATFAEAIQAGADYVVVGRAITAAVDPRAAAIALREEGMDARSLD